MGWAVRVNSGPLHAGNPAPSPSAHLPWLARDSHQPHLWRRHRGSQRLHPVSAGLGSKASLLSGPAGLPGPSPHQ